MTEPALLVVGHGTRDACGVREFCGLVEHARTVAPEIRVGGGFLELSPPPISVAVDQLAEAGARDVVVVPLMLLAAGHVKGDIPASIARERLRHPQIRFRYARDLGVHPVVLEILSERLAAVVASGEEAETAVLVCGRGSSDPDANADMYKLSRLLHEGRAFPFVETSFIGITRPLLPDGLERCRRLGAQRIVVVPHFLFTGVLHKRIHAQCKTFARAYPGVEVRAAPYIGPDVRIAGLVWERYREAIDGDPRMNCDVCVHRVALPGFEDEVGAPAVPHFHPDEPRAHLHVHGLT